MVLITKAHVDQGDERAYLAGIDIDQERRPPLARADGIVREDLAHGGLA